MSRCKCSHLRLYHEESKGLCHGSVVCGCGEYRRDDGRRWPPADHRDDYDPDGPIQRRPS